MQKTAYCMTGLQLRTFIKNVFTLLSSNRVVLYADQRVILDITLAWVVMGIFLSPVLAGLFIVYALIKQCSIEVYNLEDN